MCTFMYVNEFYETRYTRSDVARKLCHHDDVKNERCNNSYKNDN